MSNRPERNRCKFNMVLAGTAIDDPEDSRASASLWHG